jgi:type I restriction-modification system DNA methylase subunit
LPELNWQEIRDNARAFAREWEAETREASEAQTFWNEFFQIFGIRRRTVATFEEPVRNIRGQYGFIDLFWQGVVLVEHKSAGQPLSIAESQAFDYIQDLAREGRHNETPRYVILSDFRHIALYDLEPEQGVARSAVRERAYSFFDFPLSDLPARVREFAFIKGERPLRVDPEDPANQSAYELMCSLHDELAEGGFRRDDLERFLVRILFCLFAEDTGIFEPNSFQSFLRQYTGESGHDFGGQLNHLFEVLNTPTDLRPRTMPEELAGFPYVNGELFAARLGFPSFTRSMRDAVIASSEFQWARISPAVFGALFQGVLEAADRRQQGAHYTPERDILKVVRSLFLDALQSEYAGILEDRSTRRRTRLEAFLLKLRNLRFLDPACGCGNFLIITYRELRALEIEVVRRLQGSQTHIDVRQLLRVDVDQFYGIELSEWPCRIAEVALWLMDHQMNQRASDVLGQSYRRLPLRSTPHIWHANALRVDWQALLPASDGGYVLGNPPFVGKHLRTPEQNADMRHVFAGLRNTGDLDYVSCWFKRAAEYSQHSRVRTGLVATSSITQGEQVPVLWGLLFGTYHVKIHFAHRSFPWSTEARGAAHVHVVVIGFAAFDVQEKHVVDYEPDEERPSVTRVPSIGPYLTSGPETFVRKRTRPLQLATPPMRCGNKPSDGGNLILTTEERVALLRMEPSAEPYVRPYVGTEELLNGDSRWCLWLADVSAAALRAMPNVHARVERVRRFRMNSDAAPTRSAAETPSRFFYVSQPTSAYIAVPEVSSERRRYIPVVILEPSVIASNKLYVVPSADMWLLGLLSSVMHMAWMRVVSGRLESRYQYSGSMVYNTFPHPEDPPPVRRDTVVSEARDLVALRSELARPRGPSTLADLYDPVSMPPDLVRAHARLDRAVERCYRQSAFSSESERFEFLFGLHERLLSPLVEAARPRRLGRRAGSR